MFHIVLKNGEEYTAYGYATKDGVGFIQYIDKDYHFQMKRVNPDDVVTIEQVEDVV